MIFSYLINVCLILIGACSIKNTYKNPSDFWSSNFTGYIFGLASIYIGIHSFFVGVNWINQFSK
jgi:hypothetical protein